MHYDNKVKCSHTRYRALGTELISVYRQSAHRWLEAIHPVVGCHYFPLGLRLPSQLKSVTAHRPYQIILLGDRGTCVWAACPRPLLGSGPAEPTTFRIASKRSTIKPCSALWYQQSNNIWHSMHEKQGNLSRLCLQAPVPATWPPTGAPHDELD